MSFMSFLLLYTFFLFYFDSCTYIYCCSGLNRTSVLQFVTPDVTACVGMTVRVLDSLTHARWMWPQHFVWSLSSIACFYVRCSVHCTICWPCFAARSYVPCLSLEWWMHKVLTSWCEQNRDSSSAPCWTAWVMLMADLTVPCQHVGASPQEPYK